MKFYLIETVGVYLNKTNTKLVGEGNICIYH